MILPDPDQAQHLGRTDPDLGSTLILLPIQIEIGIKGMPIRICRIWIGVNGWICMWDPDVGRHKNGNSDPDRPSERCRSTSLVPYVLVR
jgi:hypothetical protein